MFRQPKGEGPMDYPDYTVIQFNGPSGDNRPTTYLWVRHGGYWYEINLRDGYRFTGGDNLDRFEVVAEPVARR